MFFDNTFYDIAARGGILTAAALLWVVLLVQIVGLRSFSKMTAFDFVMTIASGSLMAGAAQASEWSAFAQAMVALAALFVVQWIIARLRKDSDTVQDVMENEPALLMVDGRFCDKALEETRVTRSDIIAKLREANVMAMEEVCAVVLETTGDISVLHGESVDPAILEGVRDLRERPDG